MRQNNAKWRARLTPIFQLPIDQAQARLGVTIDDALLAAAMQPAPDVAPNFDQAVDWRDRNGGNHATLVKDQGQCGSCVSFAISALVESMASIEFGGQQLNLSEADLHFCSDHGATCDGWWPESALDEVRTRGVPDDAYFPYASAFPGGAAQPPVCRASPDRNGRSVRIRNFGSFSNNNSRKIHLTTVGPVAACLHVYADFYSYGSGIYHHVSGNFEGDHCVLVIGYSEADQCWIAKNSWGTLWGESGFFRIAYGECGIDTEFPFWTARDVVLANRIVSTAPYMTGTVNVAAVAADGRLLQFYFNAQTGGWELYDISALAGGAPPIVAASPYVTSTVNVAAVAADGRLLQFYWNAAGNGRWEVWNVTTMARFPA